MDSSLCTVCNNEVKNSYCSNCGQKRGFKEATLKSIFIEFFSILFSTNKSVIASISHVLKSPFKLVHNYWQGHRGYYISPMRLLIYSMVIVALCFNYTDNTILGLSLDLEGYKAQFTFWVLFFPLITLSSYLCFFRTRKSFVKHIISIAYIGSSFLILFTILFVIIKLFTDDIYFLVFFSFLTSIFVWNSYVFSSVKKPTRIILNTFLQFLVLVLLLLFLTVVLHFTGNVKIGI